MSDCVCVFVQGDSDQFLEGDMADQHDSICTNLTAN